MLLCGAHQNCHIRSRSWRFLRRMFSVVVIVTLLELSVTGDVSTIVIVSDRLVLAAWPLKYHHAEFACVFSLLRVFVLDATSVRRMMRRDASSMGVAGSPPLRGELHLFGEGMVHYLFMYVVHGFTSTV